MRRLTKKDWEVINACLAYCESGSADDAGLDEEEWEHVPDVRAKVWERLR